jgi:hypothetical protein
MDPIQLLDLASGAPVPYICTDRKMLLRIRVPRSAVPQNVESGGAVNSAVEFKDVTTIADRPTWMTDAGESLGLSLPESTAVSAAPVVVQLDFLPCGRCGTSVPVKYRPGIRSKKVVRMIDVWSAKMTGRWAEAVISFVHTTHSATGHSWLSMFMRATIITPRPTASLSESQYSAAGVESTFTRLLYFDDRYNRVSMIISYVDAPKSGCSRERITHSWVDHRVSGYEYGYINKRQQYYLDRRKINYGLDTEILAGTGWKQGNKVTALVENGTNEICAFLPGK